MKKIFLIFVLLLGVFLLTSCSCSSDKKTYTCYEYTESVKYKNTSKFVTLDMLATTYKEVKLYLNYQDHTFKRVSKFQDEVADEIYTGTFEEGEDKLTFNYDSDIKKHFENEWGKEVYVFVGNELHMRLERGTTAPSGTVWGPIVMKYK
ncbi:MAG TPA: hypothetical protein PLE44_00315 [Bacilli bacterium]|nr:hypothetical protein [Bacilli bacterium]HOR52826.1 hypothetical protein [Bacilli bacterium]HPL58798.1 hypothetical protein [Bacilli bacterium]